MNIDEVFVSILFIIAGLLVLHFIIETAVRNAINKSVIGKWIEKKYGITDDKKSFPDKDLDND